MPDPVVAETDDEILEKAKAENQAAAAEEKARLDQEPKGPRPSKAEVLTVLDQHMVFNIFSVRDGKSDPCPSVSGDLVWYFAEADAAAAMEERKNTHPYPLAMGCTPLGRAFAMTEGWIQTQGKMPPLRLQGSLADLKEFAEQAKDLCPAVLRRKFNQRTSPLPIFSIEEIHDESCEPYFFDRQQMVQYWSKKVGGSVEGLAANLVITDLRVLVMRMLTKASDWARITIFPTAGSVQLFKQLSDMAQADAAKAGASTGEAAAPATNDPNDEPPPLVGDDEPPPLT